MSLEKSIQKLTQVIKAATPAPDRRPADAPFGRETETRDPCTRSYEPGHPMYCFCYKQKNKNFNGTCCYQSSNGNCYCLIYEAKKMDPKDRVRDLNCANSPGILGGPENSPTT